MGDFKPLIATAIWEFLAHKNRWLACYATLRPAKCCRSFSLGDHLVLLTFQVKHQLLTPFICQVWSMPTTSSEFPREHGSTLDFQGCGRQGQRTQVYPQDWQWKCFSIIRAYHQYRTSDGVDSHLDRFQCCGWHIVC